MKTISIKIDDVHYELLKTLDHAGSVRAVLMKLADHAAQGVYRPGAWEREWLLQAFLPDFIKKLEPGDPFGRPGCEKIFQRPKTIAHFNE